jgi:hypothetical protein
LNNYFKKYERAAFVLLFLLTLACGVLGVYCILAGSSKAAKWVGTTGLLATATGVFQLDVSGLFERIIDHYGNEEKYPYGPPSYVTREIIDNPDRLVSTWLRNICFFNARTGFWLIVFGTLIQVSAVWL